MAVSGKSNKIGIDLKKKRLGDHWSKGLLFYGETQICNLEPFRRLHNSQPVDL